MIKSDIVKRSLYISTIQSIIEEFYPIEAAYSSRASLFGEAFKDGIVTKEEYDIAKEYYGNLWNYVEIDIILK